MPVPKSGSPVKRILFVASFAESVLAFRGALIEEFKRAGWEVHLAVPALSSIHHGARVGLAAAAIKLHEIPLRRTGTNPALDIAALWSLYRLMLRLRPDCVLSYTVKPVVYGTLAARLAGVSKRFALITGLGYAFTGSRAGLLRFVVSCLYKVALSSASKVFFQNPDDRRLFIQSGIVPPDVPAVVVNGSGVDLDEFAQQPIVGGSTVFLMVGRLLGDKGVREYAGAAKSIRAKYPDVRFQLAGWIDENPDSIEVDELEEWAAGGVIEFLGRLSDVRPAMEGCTVYVLPSYREGTPRTVLEAMAVGRAIITTDAPGCRETVIPGDNGFLVLPGSAESLVEAMEKLIVDPALARLMGERSRKIAEDRYDVIKVNAAMLREMEVGFEGARA